MTWIGSVIWAAVNISSSDDISQNKKGLNVDYSPSSITTYLIPSSTPQRMQCRVAVQCILAPVIGQCVSQLSPAFYHKNNLSIWFNYDKSGSLYLISEAILALQSEVSRLKEELQQCLVQLPHLAQEMEHLTSARERRSKTRTRSHHRPTYNRWESIPSFTPTSLKWFISRAIDIYQAEHCQFQSGDDRRLDLCRHRSEQVYRYFIFTQKNPFKS